MQAPLVALLLAQHACLMVFCLRVLFGSAPQKASMASPPASQAFVHASDFQGSLTCASSSSSGGRDGLSEIKMSSKGLGYATGQTKQGDLEYGPGGEEGGDSGTGEHARSRVLARNASWRGMGNHQYAQAARWNSSCVCGSTNRKCRTPSCACERNFRPVRALPLWRPRAPRSLHHTQDSSLSPVL
jgi:hypothetical protein